MELQLRDYDVPFLDKLSTKKDPFKLLISCILSLRTKDNVTYRASQRLFNVASTPFQLTKLSSKTVERLIYPVGFWRKKAKVILEISKKIINEYGGRVPNDREKLLSLKGVGRKTANLVLGLGFGIPSICVDTHVHRISNRIGLVTTRTPQDTEYALQKIFPEDEWIRINSLFVAFGQNICRPLRPLCKVCRIRKYCKYDE